MILLNFAPFPTLFTQRLILRQLKMEDDNEIFYMRSDAVINQYTGITKAESINDARQHIEKINTGIENNEWIMWGICLKDDPQLIGTIGLWHLDAEENTAEIGYVLIPAFQKKGIMYEALSAVMEYSFTVMQLSSVVADLEIENLASVRVLERAGFVFEQTSDIGALYVLEKVKS